MLSREQPKQNLCEVVEGHCTKRVSSNVLWQSRHFMGMLSALEGGEEAAAGLPAGRLDTGLAEPLRVGEREEALTFLPLLQGLCAEYPLTGDPWLLDGDFGDLGEWLR